MKPDREINNNQRKSQGVVSATPATPRHDKESENRKFDDKKKVKPGKRAQSAGQGK